MSWKLGKSKSSKPDPNATISSPQQPPTPSSHKPSAAPANAAASPVGLLTITVIASKGLSLPPGVPLPPSIESVLKAQQPQANAAAAVAASVGAQGSGHRSRESVQRKQSWFLPYVVLEFDKNEVLVDALGGDMASPVWMYKAVFDVSRASEVTLSAYLRTAPSVSGQNRSDMGDDLFLGGLKFTPGFDQQPVDSWVPASAGTGQFHIQVHFKPRQESLTIGDFDLLKVIGKGSFGKVMQVRKKDTSRIYALKTIRKAHIVSRSEVTHTLAERTVLGQVNNPFIVPLKFSFQNPEKLYLGLAFVNGGELFHHLQREGRFSEDRARFYAAELLCALEHLHGFNVIYRDLKPENILLDYTGHIALCDFGLCKLNMSESETTNTFCGTPEYLAPELLLGHGYTKVVDWWTLGVLLFEMMTGLPPFYDENVNTMYQRILHDPLRFPDDVAPPARSILTGLLTRDPAQRLGANGSEDIKSHPFFSVIDWRKLLAKKIQPPFKPSVASAVDTSNFDSEFTSEKPMDSVVEDSHLSETVQQQFAGFSYTADRMGESLAATSLMSP